MLHITGRVALTWEDLEQGLAKSLRFGLICFNSFTHIHKFPPLSFVHKLSAQKKKLGSGASCTLALDLLLLL